MFELPTLWNFVVSTLVFFIATAYVKRYLEGQGVADGRTRTILVLVLASVMSWGAGAAADWAEGQLDSPTAVQAGE